MIQFLIYTPAWKISSTLGVLSFVKSKLDFRDFKNTMFSKFLYFAKFESILNFLKHFWRWLKRFDHFLFEHIWKLWFFIHAIDRSQWDPLKKNTSFPHHNFLDAIGMGNLFCPKKTKKQDSRDLVTFNLSFSEVIFKSYRNFCSS